MVKNPPAMEETWVQSLGREDPLEQEMATHSSILGWRIPWKEEPTQTSLSGELIDKVWPTHTRRRGEALTVLPRGQTPQILC